MFATCDHEFEALFAALDTQTRPAQAKRHLHHPRASVSARPYDEFTHQSANAPS